MTCKMCLEARPLCDSHIIPKFFFRQRNKNSPMYEVGNQDPLKKRIPTGWYEKLLCSWCEQHLGRYDDYAAKFFNGFENWEKVTIGDMNLYKINDYDHKKLKLFFMSVLWRAGIATIDAFESTDLGRYEEVFRQMILNDNPGKYEDFSVTIFIRKSIRADLHKILCTPRREKFNSVNYYTIELNEFFYCIKVDRRKHLECFSEVSLTETPPLWIMETSFQEGKYRAIKSLLQNQIESYKTFQKSKVENNREVE